MTYHYSYKFLEMLFLLLLSVVFAKIIEETKDLEILETLVVLNKMYIIQTSSNM